MACPSDEDLRQVCVCVCVCVFTMVCEHVSHEDLRQALRRLFIKFDVEEAQQLGYQEVCLSSCLSLCLSAGWLAGTQSIRMHSSFAMKWRRHGT